MKIIKKLVRFSTKLPFFGRYIHHAMVLYVRLRDAGPSLVEVASMVANVSQLEQTVLYLTNQLSRVTDLEQIVLHLTNQLSRVTSLEQTVLYLTNQLSRVTNLEQTITELSSQTMKLELTVIELSEQVSELTAEGKNLLLSTPVALRKLRCDLNQLEEKYVR